MLAADPRYRVPKTLAAFCGALALLAAIQLKFHPASAQSTIAFVQVNSAVPQSPSTTVAVTYAAAQTAGNLNVIVVGWNDTTAVVQSVVDSRGNVYTLAVGPTARAGSATQSIYYAANIAAAPANGNTVTVTFAPAAIFADIRIAEYRGIATTNSVDVVAGASGSSATANSGAVTTTNANDLLVGANTVQTITSGAGSSFTQRIITSPDADILEDRIVTAVGSYSATAPMASGWWVMQMVAFKAAASPTDTQPPTAPGTPVLTVVSSTRIDLTWPVATDNIAVTGYRVERCAGANCTTFAQVGTPTTASFSNTGLAPATSYSYRVRATDAAGNLGPYSATATAATPADTQAPTAPGTPVLTVVSISQINLTWPVATDNVAVTGYRVERCAGANCTTFAQVAAPATTSFNDTGLTPSTSYSYRVRATDAAGNLGAYSTTATATTQADTLPPTAPGTPVLTVLSSSQINLSWVAATDNVGVTSYRVERCAGANCATFAQVGTPATPSFSDTGLNASTSYSYRVRATDAAGNLGAYSGIASGSTLPPVQNIFVIVMENFSWAQIKGNAGAPYINSLLTIGAHAEQYYTPPGLHPSLPNYIWMEAGTNFGITTNDTPAVLHQSTTAHLTTLLNNAGISWKVYAEGILGTDCPLTDEGTSYAARHNPFVYFDDITNNLSATSAVCIAHNRPYSELATDLTNNTVARYNFIVPNLIHDMHDSDIPTGDAWLSTEVTRILNSQAYQSNGALFIAWDEGFNDSDGPLGLIALSPFAKPGYSNTIHYTHSSLLRTIQEFLGVSTSWLGDAANATDLSDLFATTVSLAPPTNLSATPVSSSQVNLSWTASTSPTVTGYLIERCQGAGCTTFAQVATSNGTTYNDTGRITSTSYSYRVRATDAANNLSAYSSTATATTLPDTQPPTAPGTLVLTIISTGQINLTWPAATDDVGVTGYLVERCAGAGCSTFTQVGAPASTSFNDTGLTASTSYTYRVRATDAAGNLGPYSPTGTATTLADTQPPTAPGTPVPTVISTSQINLTWPVATDNISVTGYRVERCAGAGCSTFSQVAAPATASFNDTGLTPSTSYSYRVRATDAAGNLGPYSATATATTQADTQPPTAPGTPVPTVVSTSQINLTWPAATDDVAVTGYRVERCAGAGCSTTFAQVGTPATASFSDTGLSASTSYSYRVRATDAAGNLGAYSATATATTLGTNPSLVAAYAFNEGSGTTVADLSGRGNTGTIANATWATGKYDSALAFNGSNALVTIADSASLHLTTAMTLEAWVNPSVVSSAWRDVIYKGNDNYYLEGTTTVGAGVPTGAATIAGNNNGANGTSALTANTWSHLAVTFDGATVRLYVNGTQVGTLAQAGTIVTSTNPLQIGGDSIYGQFFQGMIDEVRVYNTALTLAQIQADMNAPIAGSVVDSQPPAAPGTLVATAISQGQINLNWTAATDNFAVTGYRIERCQGAGCSNFVEITAAGTATTFSDATNLTAGTSYSYRVRATDAAGNLSPYSNTSSATTLAPDTTPPSAPGVLTATVISGAEIDISWGAATDNVGIAGYRVDRCQGAGCTTFSKLGTLVTGTTFADTSLNPNTSYSYMVAAQDLAGNLGPYTNVATATTLATNPNLVAAYAFGEGAGTTTADTSGRGNTGTISNATWTTGGKYGNALSFNGSTALVTIADNASLHLTTGMTLEAWVNPTAISSAWRDILYKGNDNYYLEATTSFNSGFPAGAATIGGNSVSANGAAFLALNTWSHLAATFDGTTLRLYLNGTQTGSFAQAGTILTSTIPLQIGGDTIYGQYFQGLIDEVRVYNVALTPAQIQADMITPLSGAFPRVSLSTNTLTFSSQDVGTTSSPMSVTVTNTGTVGLVISSVTIAGTQSGDFAQSNSCGVLIAPAATCSINVTFTPAASGSRNATLTIADNAPGTPHLVALTGTGAGLTISPKAVVVVANRTSQFTSSGGTGSVTWSVDNIAGGSSAVGTITTGGLYTAPATVGSHTVTASASGKFSSGVVYVSNHAGVFTHHNDKSRTGQNLSELVLTTANVNAATFGKLATFSTDGIAHASPLYVANVNVPSVGLRNVVYVATEHDSVYAFDAEGNGSTFLWKVSFINPGAGITSVPNGDTNECCDIAPEIGITGTPVIDTTSNTLYVVAKTKEGASTYVNRLHALDLATGTEKFGGPVVIQASVSGTGNGSVGGTLSFDQLRENQRTALVLNNGVVYFGFGSHGDNQPYHGWLFGYNATTLQRVFVYASTPNGEGGGIWLSGGGPIIDSSNNFFFATGDGTFSANTGGVDFGDSFLKLSSAGAVLDYFTPHNQATLNTNNLDLDAGGMILLPDQPGTHPHLLVSAGKDGSIFLVDRDNMTHFNATDQNVQTLANIFPFGTPLPGNYSSPVYYNGYVYFAPVADVLQAFKLNNGLLTTAPTSTSPQAYPYPGGALAISANGNTNGILWAVQKNNGPGTLRAYDAGNLAFELYNSDQAGTRDTLDIAAKFAIPLVVNGKVFVASNSQLTVYGLLP
jgi:chitodextrinase